eukprot:4146692-Amphidinium_carterae.1
MARQESRKERLQHLERAEEGRIEQGSEDRETSQSSAWLSIQVLWRTNWHDKRGGGTTCVYVAVETAPRQDRA